MSDEHYIVSARKYRPSDFRSVVGQKALTETLKNAVKSRRLAQAYLFCGPRGVGKTSCARIFAKTINCLNPTPDGEACGECEACLAIENGSSFNIVELDAASNNSVDDIRNLTEQVNIPPSIGRYRVFIIDEVHMLSSAAFNAFLKTLEEPPSYVIFILATTEKHKVIPTILSRCQIYDFKRITIQDMVEHLQYVAGKEGITSDIPSLNVIAKKADGAMRDALSIFDQVAASSFGNITYESTINSLNVLDYEYYFRLVEAFRSGDIPQALMIYKEIRDHGFDSLFFINGLAAHIRDLMVAYSPATASLLEVADDVALHYQEQARKFPPDWHYAAMKILNDCDYQYRLSSNKQFLVELSIIRLCQLLNPPTPPFDRVDSDSIPLRDLAIPHQNQVAPVATPPTKIATGVKAETIDRTETVATSAKNASVTKDKSDSKATSTANPNPPADAASAKTQRRKSNRTSFRLTESTGNLETTQLQRQRETFSPEDFAKTWEEFTIAHPEKHILVSAMRKALPSRKDDETYKVIVDHPAQVQAFESDMKELITYLRTNLKNDFLSIEVELDQKANTIKQIPQQELLNDIVSKNPVLGNFLAGIDGELA